MQATGSRKVTLLDVAKACGVSRATVSLVVSGSALVAARTRQQVKTELERSGYVYNRAAANLRARFTSSVGLIINDLANPFFPEFMEGVSDTLAGHGVVTLFAHTGECGKRESAALRSMAERGVDGVILCPTTATRAASVVRAVGRSLPLVVFNRALLGTPAERSWDTLLLGNEVGARAATEHLLSLGHRRIALVGGHRLLSPWSERQNGYRDAMRAAGLEVDPDWIVTSKPTRDAGPLACNALLTKSSVPTAAVCYNDSVALGLQAAMERHDPGFTLTGFDDVREASRSVRPLTTIAVDPVARGAQAALMLLDRVKDAGAPVRCERVPGRLVVRHDFTSGRPPPRAA